MTTKYRTTFMVDLDERGGKNVKNVGFRNCNYMRELQKKTKWSEIPRAGGGLLALQIYSGRYCCVSGTPGWQTNN